MRDDLIPNALICMLCAMAVTAVIMPILKWLGAFDGKW